MTTQNLGTDSPRECALGRDLAMRLAATEYGKVAARTHGPQRDINQGSAIQTLPRERFLVARPIGRQRTHVMKCRGDFLAREIKLATHLREVSQR